MAASDLYHATLPLRHERPSWIMTPCWFRPRVLCLRLWPALGPARMSGSRQSCPALCRMAWSTASPRHLTLCQPFVEFCRVFKSTTLSRDAFDRLRAAASGLLCACGVPFARPFSSAAPLVETGKRGQDGRGLVPERCRLRTHRFFVQVHSIIDKDPSAAPTRGGSAHTNSRATGQTGGETKRATQGFHPRVVGWK